MSATVLLLQGSAYRLGEQEVWALVYVLSEHQSAEDPVMPLRFLYFVVLYWGRQWRAWEQAAAAKPLAGTPRQARTIVARVADDP